MTTCLPSRTGLRIGFSTRWAVASAADRVIVKMKPVAMKPIRASTSTLLDQKLSCFSSIDSEPSPLGLSLATRRYMGNAPNRVMRTRTSVATGARSLAATAAMPGW